MGGEGSMMAANQSLKSNRNMLSKRKEKTFSFVSNSTGKTEYNLPKASKEDIRLLRDKLQKERRQTRVKRIIITTIAFVLLIVFINFFIVA